MVLKKSQRVLSFVLSLVMLLALSSVFCITRADAASEGEWNYELENGGATITSYIGTSKTVTVPAKIAGHRVLKVSGLFTNHMKSSITSISFSNGILQIGDGLCKEYIALEKVTLPDTLTSIGNDAFFGCTSLKGITVPSTVSSIGSGAFGNCPSLISADLSCQVTEIPAKLFASDTSLSTLKLPNYITSIGDMAFEGCSSLRSVTLPDTVKTIGTGSFSSCTGLENISLSADLKTIGNLAMYNCSKLTSVFIPNKTKTLNDEIFTNCSSLKEVYISNSVSIIKNELFRGCENLESVVFGGDYYNFGSLGITSDKAIVYYPAKYASGWSEYLYSIKKSYQSPSMITITGSQTVAPGGTVNLKISINGDFKDAYALTSSNPNVATISADGTVIARATGTTTITVTTITGTTKTFDITVKPNAPTEVKAASKTISSVDITWKPTYNAAGYIVYRSTSKSGTYKNVGTTTSTTFTDKGLTKGKTYYYKVAAYVTSGSKKITSAYSNVASVKVSAPAPATITAKKVKSGSAKITWGKSTGASGYEVYMATSKSGKYTKIATINKATTLSYTKSGLKSGKTYYFKVRSYVTVNGTKVYSGYTKIVSAKV